MVVPERIGRRMARKKKNPVYTGRGTTNPNRIAQIIVEAGSRGSNSIYAGLRQAIENGVDAGASRINIVVNKKKKILRIEDNGHGFGNAEVDGFLSLLVSNKRGLEDLIGRNGSGRTLMFTFCDTLRVYTRSETFPETVTFQLTVEDLEKIILNGTIDNQVHKAVGDDVPKIGKTGSVICLEGVKWEKISAAELRKKLAYVLSPEIAKTVFVNGRLIDPRELKGDVIQNVVTVDYLPGKQKYILYLPKTVTSDDRLEIAAINPLCSISALIKQSDGVLHGGVIPTELTNGAVFGGIYIPALNAFRGHDSEHLNNDFFDSDLLPNVIRFLDEVVAPEVRKALKLRDEAERTQANLEMLNQLCEVVNPVWEGFDEEPVSDEDEDGGDDEEKEGGSDKPEGKIKLSTHRITIVPGDQHEVHIVSSPGTSGKFVWDRSNSGCKVTKLKNGKAVRVIANTKHGEFCLTVSDAKDSSISAKCKIRIVEERSLTISPMDMQIVSGDRQRFRVVNHDLVEGEILWKVSPRAGVSLSDKKGIQVQVTTKPETVGDYEIMAYDTADPDNCATATFEVVPSDDEHMLCIEGTWYKLELADSPIPNVVKRDPKAVLNLAKGDGSALDRMWIDVTHPLLEGARRVSKAKANTWLTVLPHLIAAHLKGRVEDDKESPLDENSMHRRLVELHTQILEHRNSLE